MWVIFVTLLVHEQQVFGGGNPLRINKNKTDGKAEQKAMLL